MGITQTSMIAACLAILVFIAVIVTANALNLGSIGGPPPLSEQQKTDSALRNVIASSLNYIHTADYDSTPYAVKGHIALSMPCDARNPQAPLFHILVGRAPDLAPAAVGYLSQMSNPPDTCVYHSQFGFGDPVTDIVLKNVSNRTLTLSGPHSITITTHEAYIPAAPSLEEMQMLKMSQANATK